LLACVAEEHHDEHGLVWPITVAPYHVYIAVLRGNEEVAERLYADLQTAGVEVLYDDRNERPGVKFNDADLIGIPIRLTVSGRAMEAGGFELKLRHSPDRIVIPAGEVIARVKEQIEALQAEIDAQVVPVPYQ